jgi:membrane fusion protein (multidrug efflux system)
MFNRTYFVKSLLLTIAVISFSSCGSNEQPADMSYTQKPQVDFLQVNEASSEIQITYPGNIEGSVNVDIRSQVSGYLEKIYVKEGDYVQRGQALFKIKGDVFNEQVNNSQAALQNALASQVAAQLEVDKLEPLVEAKVVSDMQIKVAKANYESAKAQVSQAKASLGSSQINAAFAVIKAPVSGYIGRIPNRTGNLVTPADAIPLTTLSDINDVFVYFAMSEADFIEFLEARKTDDKISTVDLVMANGAAYSHKGKLEIASGNVERTTGTISLKAVFPNPDKILRSGGSGRIVLTKRLSESLAIPMASVKDIQDRLFVFALADSNKVSMRPITVDGRSGENYIVKSGLTKGDKIALNNIDVLADGVPVEPAATGSAKVSSK